MSGGWPNRRFRMGWLLVGCGMLAGTGLGAPACSSDDSKQELPQLGKMALDLTATDASGAQYRLRDGVFEITALSSEESFVVSTEDDPDATTIDIQLDADLYSVFLHPGYFLEQVSEGGGGGEGGAGGEGPGVEAAPELKRLSELMSFRAQHPQRKAGSRSTRTTAVAATPRAELPHPVDAELVSENPALAQVTASETTQVDFVFSLEPGAGGDGELSIGIDVVGSGSIDCEPDNFEPNNSPEQAPLIDPPITATACELDEDFYLVDPPVAAGEAFRVLVEFQHALGDIDCALADSAGNVVATSTGTTDQEQLVTTSNGGQYLLYVYPFAGEASYTVSIASFSQSNCCEASENPTCADPEVGQCVCDIDPFCCSGSFDEVCVEEAISACNLTCELPEPDSDCCTPGEHPSCTDPGIAECTCGIDPLCCAHPFDENCVDIAAGFCGAECGGL